MDLTLNGATHTHRGDGSLEALLREVQAQPDRVAVVVNGEMVPRPARAGVVLRAGDRVELLTFAGGG